MERSRAAALDTAAHFLVTTGTVLEEDVAKFLSLEQELPQRFPEVTSPVVARSMDFNRGFPRP